LVLLFGEKLTLRLLATITPEVVHFHTYALFPTFLPFFKLILEAVLCEGVQHHVRFCLDLLNFVKMTAFQFCLQSGKEKSRVGGDDSRVVFGQKYPGEEGNVRRCVVVMLQPVLLLPKFWRSLHTFLRSRHKTS
jgi:hypothetical protein